MKTILTRKRFLLAGFFGVILFAILACSLFIFSSPIFSIYPNAEFQRISSFSIKYDIIPMFAEQNKLPPNCLRVRYRLIYQTLENHEEVGTWFLENGWLINKDDDYSGGLKVTLLSDLDLVKTSVWVHVALTDQTNGPTLMEMTHVYFFCEFL